MNIENLQEIVGNLDSYGAWREAEAKQIRAFNRKPLAIDTNNVDQLNQQIKYVDLSNAQLEAREEFKVDIASRDDLIPLTYRLGILAALDATNKPLEANRIKKTRRGLVVSLSYEDRSEQRITPHEDPILLAQQVGDELENLTKIFSTKRSVPVAMVWHHRYLKPRLSYDEVVCGTVNNPKEAFVLDEPTVIDTNENKKVIYSVPSKLNGVEKGQVIKAFEYVRSANDFTNPMITRLARLGIFGINTAYLNPDELYIGKNEVKERVSKARYDNAVYENELARIREHNERLRRRYRHVW